MAQAKRQIEIRESVDDVLHFHLAIDHECLCGTNETMITNIEVPVNTWGTRTNLGETYCTKCDRIGKEKGIIPWDKQNDNEQPSGIPETSINDSTPKPKPPYKTAT